MDSPSDDQLRRWIQSLKSDRPFKFDGGFADNAPISVQQSIMRIAKEEGRKKYEAKRKHDKVVSAVLEATQRDVRTVLAKYRVDKPVRGYINVFGWYAP